MYVGKVRAAVYLRQSLDREGTGLAIDRQRRDCLTLCETKGWRAAEYVDNSVSASSRKPRPAYVRMLADIEAGQVDAVVVWDLDRLHRQPAELEHFITLADRHQLALATVTGDTDLSTDNGRLFARIKGAVARAEVERKSARQKAAHAQRAADGRPWANRRPFGFEADGVTHHPTEAAVLRGIYNDILAGVSQTSIARRLNEDGHLSTLGNPWRQSSLRQLLINPRNAGLRARHGEIVGAATWDPIVPEDTWRAVVAIVTSHPQAGTRGATHLLSGLTLCGLCGARLTTAYTIRKVRIYACTGCQRIGRKAEPVEQLVTDTILTRLSRPDAHDLLVDKSAPDAGQLQAKAATLRLRLEQVAQDFADGDLTISEWRAARDRIKSHLAAVEEEMSHPDATALLGPLIQSPDAEAAWNQLTTDRRRAIIRATVTVTIHPTRQGSRFRPEDVAIAWTPLGPA